MAAPANARPAHPSLARPCAGVPVLAWAAGKRTACTPLSNFWRYTAQKKKGGLPPATYPAACPIRTRQLRTSKVPKMAVQPCVLPEFHAPQDFVANGRACAGVRPGCCRKTQGYDLHPASICTFRKFPQTDSPAGLCNAVWRAGARGALLSMQFGILPKAFPRRVVSARDGYPQPALAAVSLQPALVPTRDSFRHPHPEFFAAYLPPATRPRPFITIRN